MKIWLSVKCSELCKVIITDGKVHVYESTGYPPDFIPGGTDNVELLIDADTGRIVNWQTCSEMVKKYIEEQRRNN